MAMLKYFERQWLDLGSTWHQAVQNRPSSRLISKKVKIKRYKIEGLILPLVLSEDETWCVTLREEHRLRVHENTVSSTFGSKREEVTLEWRNWESFIICTLHQILKLGGKRSLWRLQRRWQENTKLCLRKYNEDVWSGVMRLRIQTNGGL